MPNECGNPLLRDWVKEWMDQAQAIQSKAYFTYKKAYDSLCKCPVPFSHPSEAIKLDGIGEGMVKRLTSNMKKYCQDNNLPMPEYPMSKKRKTSPNDTQDALEGSSRPRAKRAPKPYVPAYRTGGYAIMLALLDFHQVGQPSVTKEQICRIAQAHCDASLTLADPGKSYTAFSSIKTLCEKGYVWKNGKPARFQLTETGISLAERLKSTNIDKQASPSSPSLSLSQPFSVSSQTPSALPDLSQTPLANLSPSLPNSALSNSSQQSTDIESQAFFPSPSQQSSEPQPDYVAMLAREPIDVLLPDQYEIVLVIDSREIQMKGKRDYFEQTLTAKGVSCITRSLDLGDAIWIARSKSNPPQELFLDYIVERKRLDDLVSSIKDGRFTEQKLRLKRSGAEKLIYVVEEYNRDEAERFGAQAIQTAMSSTQIIDGIFLKRTSSIDDTIDYLVSVTRLIERIYRNTRLYVIPSHLITRQNYLGLKGACPRCQGEIAYVITYTLYNQLNAKNGSASLHEVYLRMLMTIRGVNAERALSLMKIYPTPRSLLEAFRGLSPEKAKVLAKNATKNHILRRRWGIQISERLYSIWGALEYTSSDTNPQDDEDY
ncbi:putative DNA repair protein Mus81 [Choanephora cucurbitarum]|nr:putative DNA repair protein Mus81 [Choanephora cucurbitarum]